jgi:hypothetical protein
VLYTHNVYYSAIKRNEVLGVVAHALIPGRWRQEDLEFETSLGYTARPFLKTTKNE